MTEDVMQQVDQTLAECVDLLKDHNAAEVAEIRERRRLETRAVMERLAADGKLNLGTKFITHNAPWSHLLPKPAA